MIDKKHFHSSSSLFSVIVGGVGQFQQAISNDANFFYFLILVFVKFV